MSQPFDPRARAFELEDVINSLGCGLVARDAEGVLLYVNQRLLDWTGYLRDELIGRTTDVLVPLELRERVKAELRAIVQGDLRARLIVLQRKDGTTFPVVFVPHRLEPEDSDFRGYVGIAVDLGAIQTAKQAGYRTGSDLGTAIDRIATELQFLGLSASLLPASPLNPNHPDLKLLSPREREVLLLLAAGHRVPVIGKKLFISPHTVRNHLKSIYRKVGVETQAELLEWVANLG
jgi:PAS domain S-box-containing protein